MTRQMPFRQVRSFIKLRKIKEQAGIHANAKDVYAEAEREKEHYTTVQRSGNWARKSGITGIVPGRCM